MGKTAFGSRGFALADKKLAALASIPLAQKKAALRAGAEIIAEEARRLAPKDTGRLARSIKVYAGRQARVSGGFDLPGTSVLVGPVGSPGDGDVFYAGFVEEGTSQQAAQPFMRPAIDGKRAEAEAVVLDRLNDALKQRQ